jgi:hypothetical protein
MAPEDILEQQWRAAVESSTMGEFLPSLEWLVQTLITSPKEFEVDASFSKQLEGHLKEQQAIVKSTTVTGQCQRLDRIARCWMASMSTGQSRGTGGRLD